MKSAIIISRFMDLAVLEETLGTLRVAYRKVSSRAELGTAPNNADYIFIELSLLGDFHQSIGSYKEICPEARLILLTSPVDMRECYHALRAGADNYLATPLSSEEVQFVLESEAQTQRLESELLGLKEEGTPKTPLASLFQTKSPQVHKIFEQAQAVAKTRSTVFITGESGTGKGLLARQIHDESARSHERFVSVHCGAIPEALIESELFGHEKGAFTGAIKKKLGKFELAHKGTIFLDEIGTIGPATQVKLLQIIQERVIQPLGSEREVPVDVRIIAATNSNIQELVKEGKFREDLFYRLNVFPMELLPLRERTEDLGILTQSILTKLSHTYGRVFKGVESDVLKALEVYPWPGNIRELENVLERACILERGEWLTQSSFPADFFMGAHSELGSDEFIDLASFRDQVMFDAEKRYLSELIERSNGHLTMASSLAGVSTRQIHKLLLKHKLKLKKKFD